MSKVLFSIIVFTILLGVFGNAFSASYVHSNIGNIAYVLALGIDVILTAIIVLIIVKAEIDGVRADLLGDLNGALVAVLDLKSTDGNTDKLFHCPSPLCTGVPAFLPLV